MQDSARNGYLHHTSAPQSIGHSEEERADSQRSWRTRTQPYFLYITGLYPHKLTAPVVSWTRSNQHGQDRSTQALIPGCGDIWSQSLLVQEDPLLFERCDPW